MQLDKNYWQDRYLQNETAWDVGEISPPLKAYIDKLSDKSLRILIPGGGNGHEAAYLLSKGFTEVFLLDWAEMPLAQFSSKYPDFPKEHLLQMDFFELEDHFDLILEQTFFCALSPNLREEYVDQMKSLLKEEGVLAGVLFSVSFDHSGPPYGGSLTEYESLFSKYFYFSKFEPCYNSTEARAGTEHFIKLVKK